MSVAFEEHGDYKDNVDAKGRKVVIYQLLVHRFALEF
jgi:hypothetical protein